MTHFKDQPSGFYEPKQHNTSRNPRVREIQDNAYLQKALHAEMDAARQSATEKGYQAELDAASEVLRRWYKPEEVE